VFCAFSLGAAMSDLISMELLLGYAATVFVIGGLIAAIALAHRSLRLNAVAAFWAAYVVVRPFGDSVGDLLTATPRDGGLGLGTTGTSATVLAILVIVGLSGAAARRSVGKRHGITT
jgi:uncharacterized membrane-anchored protein